MKGHHFDTTEVIVAESQVALNTVTEHDYQDAFKKWQKRWNGAYSRKGATSRVIAASRQKCIVFDQMAAPVE
jgi:hypothetical protein